LTTLIEVAPGADLAGDGQEGELTRLVRAAAAGDPRAWDAIVTRFEGLVWSIARGHRLSDADAADVVQTTWLRLVEHLGDVQAPERIGAWLATTARRATLRLLASSRRQVPSGHRQLGEDRADPHDLDADLVQIERDRALRAALEQLPAQRQALLRLLSADPQPSYEEISAALGMPIGSIGPTRARALQQLQREFERLLPVPEPALLRPARRPPARRRELVAAA
jgi:RNA polymerase sigma factor (sigma-70 family)